MSMLMLSLMLIHMIPPQYPTIRTPMLGYSHLILSDLILSYHVCAVDSTVARICVVHLLPSSLFVYLFVSCIHPRLIISQET